MEERLKYEEAVKMLEDIVKELEKSDLPLETAIELFSKGMYFVKMCKDHLEQAESKITMLIEDKEINYIQWIKEN